tara:strand:- start:968 stop:3451 length:2484 start_codon:yes stop_codon:yes gene_type:complete
MTEKVKGPQSYAEYQRSLLQDLNLQRADIFDKEEDYLDRQFMAPQDRREVDRLEYLEESVANNTWQEEPSMAFKVFLDGVLLGQTDEIAELIPAYLESVSEGKDFIEVYKEKLIAADAELDRYYAENPVEAAALGIAGTFASPVTWLTGGAVAATRTAVLASKIAQQSALVRAAAPVAVAAAGGAAEGYVSGMGTATIGEKFEGGKEGAVSGALWGGAIDSGVTLVRALSKRRIPQELLDKETGEFIPIVFSDGKLGEQGESISSRFYRDVIGKSFGGAGGLANQTDRIISKVIDNVEKLDGQLATAKRAAENAGESAKKLAQSKPKITESEIERIKGVIAEKQNIIKENLSVDERNIKQLAITQYDASVNAAESLFRQKAVKNSAPAEASQEEIQTLLNLPTREANDELYSMWRKYGFIGAKQKTDYKINSEMVLNKIDDFFVDDVAAEIYFSGKPNLVKKFVEDQLSEKVLENTIKGSDLVQLRSDLGKVLSGLPEEGSMPVRGVVSEIQEYLDDIIVAQLPANKKKAFENDRTNWAFRRSLEGAIAKASVKAGQRGEFTANQWLQTLGSYSKKLMARGKGLLQEEADKIGDLVNARDKTIEQIANKELQNLFNESGKKLARETKGLEKELKQLEKDLVRQNVEEGITKKAIDFKVQNDPRVIELKNLKEKNVQHAKILGERAGRLDPTIFERIASTNMTVPQSVGNEGGFINTLLIGSGVAKLAAAKTTQRMVAGQTALQRGVSNIMEREGGLRLPYQAGLAYSTEEQREPIYDRDSIRSLSSADDARKAAAFERLRKTNKLEVLKRSNPRIYNVLEMAAQRQR